MTSLDPGEEGFVAGKWRHESDGLVVMEMERLALPSPGVGGSPRELMTNKKILILAALGSLVLILAVNAVLRLVTAGETEAATPQAMALLTVLTILAAPVMIYNHFTHANEGPITLMQIVLLITSSIFWGFIIERVIFFLRKRRTGGGG